GRWRHARGRRFLRCRGERGGQDDDRSLGRAAGGGVRMLTVRQLEEFDAARLRAVVEGWRHQARRYGEIGETIARVSRDRLSNWDGPASALAKQRVGDLLAGFGDTPDRLSGLADA